MSQKSVNPRLLRRSPSNSMSLQPDPQKIAEKYYAKLVDRYVVRGIFFNLKVDVQRVAKMAFNFDLIIEEVGGAGKYQALRYIILSCIPICMSWHLLGQGSKIFSKIQVQMSFRPRSRTIFEILEKPIKGNQILAAKPDQECIPNLYNPNDVSFPGVELSPDFVSFR